MSKLNPQDFILDGHKLIEYPSHRLAEILQQRYIDLSLAESSGDMDKVLKMERENIYIWEEIVRRLELFDRLAKRFSKED